LVGANFIFTNRKVNDKFIFATLYINLFVFNNKRSKKVKLFKINYKIKINYAY